MKILCVCYHNRCRSAMLEGMLKKALADQPSFQVESAGISDESNGQPADKHAIVSMAKRSIDIRSHRSRCVREIDLSTVDLIICIEPGHVHDMKVFCPEVNIFLGNSSGTIPDASKKALITYKRWAVVMQRVAAEVIILLKP